MNKWKACGREKQRKKKGDEERDILWHVVAFGAFNGRQQNIWRGCWSNEEGWRKYNRGRLLALQGVSREAKGDRPVRYAMCEITITPNALPSTQLGFRAPIHSHEVQDVLEFVWTLSMWRFSNWLLVTYFGGDYSFFTYYLFVIIRTIYHAWFLV